MVRHLRSIRNAAGWRGGGGDEDVFGVMSVETERQAKRVYSTENSEASVDTSGQCTGMGCCQTSIPANLTYFNTTFSTRRSASVLGFNPCSYAFVIETQQFRFDISDLAGYNFAYKYSDGVPLTSMNASSLSSIFALANALTQLEATAAHVQRELKAPMRVQ
ncbi:hypothetical protein C2845_PM12G30950 [Panicum miliaceum]|uniref:Uncharacterized protein n=1 Tax=Panicum miliaceum TaxID=4540 RepID=A0A3L6QMF5_PANMI|nr:hypothetical protein C2845_PM12G30950 [Panicum miliaceum]